MRSTLLIFAIGLVWVWEPALAQENEVEPVPGVAIIDFRGILEQSGATRSARAQIEKLRVKYQEEITAEEDALRKEDQELNRQRAILAPEALAERRRLFNTKVAEVQRKVQARKRELGQALNVGMQEIQKFLVGLVAEVAKQKGYTLVLPKSQVVLADSRYEITAAVGKLLNERLPSVKIKITRESQ